MTDMIDHDDATAHEDLANSGRASRRAILGTISGTNNGSHAVLGITKGGGF
jgi:hypothetical protein